MDISYHCPKKVADLGGEHSLENCISQENHFRITLQESVFKI